ncbi:hypothetical protein [Leeuwenhoekiella sp. LLG6367-2.1]|uniref:hypothetical protein n=1 Tax=Leeuwenhoekiella sp. LLG6367-2.1 TaxID=3160833 RepID=UPI00386506E6
MNSKRKSLKIYHQVENKSIYIDDDHNSYMFLQKFLMVLILANSILNLLNIFENRIRFQSVVWILMGVLSIYYLYIYFFKITMKDELPISLISHLSKRTFFRPNHYSIVLKNGKKRRLPQVKTQDDVKQLEVILATFQANPEYN